MKYIVELLISCSSRASETHFGYELLAACTTHFLHDIAHLFELNPTRYARATSFVLLAQISEFPETIGIQKLGETKSKREPLHRLDTRYEFFDGSLRTFCVDATWIADLGESVQGKLSRPLL